MNKYKIVKKLGRLQLVVNGQKGQQLSENEVYLINNKLKGMVPIDVRTKGATFKLVYDISDYVTLKEFLAIPLSKDSFTRLLQDIFLNLKALKESFLKQQAVLLDVEHVMVEPVTRRIYFIYVPIPFFQGETSLKEFLLSIIQFGVFVQNEDRGYVREYINIFNKGINFSEFELEEYIKKLSGEKSGGNDEKQECPKCHGIIKAGISHCSICGADISGKKVEQKENIYDPLKQNDSKTGLNEVKSQVNVYLIRKKTDEKIFINKELFKIGKSQTDSDYVIDSNVVSRNHASIITQDNNYYVMDLKSTNKTYVNGKVILPDMKVEIVSGTVICFANEEFTFNIK